VCDNVRGDSDGLWDLLRPRDERTGAVPLPAAACRGGPAGAAGGAHGRGQDPRGAPGLAVAKGRASGPRCPDGDTIADGLRPAPARARRTDRHGDADRRRTAGARRSRRRPRRAGRGRSRRQRLARGTRAHQRLRRHPGHAAVPSAQPRVRGEPLRRPDRLRDVQQRHALGLRRDPAHGGRSADLPAAARSPRPPRDSGAVLVDLDVRHGGHGAPEHRRSARRRHPPRADGGRPHRPAGPTSRRGQDGAPTRRRCGRQGLHAHSRRRAPRSRC
jgi:hypothetical protein